MASQLLFIGLTLLQLSLLFVVVVALHDLGKAATLLDGLLAVCATVLLLGIIGYLSYWLAFANYRVHGLVKIAVLALLVARFGYVVWRGRLPAHMEQLREPLAFVFLFCVAVLALGLSAGGFREPVLAAQTRFGYAMPPDNIIPLIIADLLRDGVIRSPMLGSWLSSDRPPLQAGLYMLLTLKMGGGGYQIVASWLQATFLFGVWIVAMAAGLTTAARRLVLLAACLLPVTILNTFYTWPKMLSVGYLLIVFALVFCYRPADRREQWAIGLLVGGMTALAMLSHGSAAFLLIGIAVMVVVTWRWPSWRTSAVALGTGAVLYAPWAAYQAFVDPPGNRLLKWHLAGVIDVDQRSFGQALREAYGALSWSGYVHGRIENFWAIVGSWPASLRELATVVFTEDDALAQKLRIEDFFNFLPALHGFSIALIAAILLLPAMGAWSRQRTMALVLLGTVLATCIAYAVLLLIPGSAVNHQATYAVHVMAAMAAMTVLALRTPMLAIGFIAIQTVTIATLYAFTLPEGWAFWPTQVLCLGATIALYLYALAPMLKGRAPQHRGAAADARSRR
jgi:hypothetical protein